MRHNNNALIVFAKQPIAGKVKTRLTTVLSPEEAAELYRCMLIDTLSKVKQLEGVDIYLFFEGNGDAASYFATIAAGMETVPQRGNNLGERMMDAFQRTFEHGYESVAIIGTDSPDLPVGFLDVAFQRLEKNGVDVVIGPTEDGGYYLLAMKRVYCRLFRDVPWSSDQVLNLSLARGAEAGITIGLLPGWYDVDTVEDLRRPGLLDKGSGAPMTREFIKKLPPFSIPA
ncbi:TIGR04282 family arsenosugar biosynthesis glycosyltransferase [Geotalea uraniireducens]|uniref:Uncharacterized protein-like protein n=1 Tax=Geotalea uraniireducens (strain Rf4) TaxID=351605 RepID=A5G8S0_GEOUR|nr:TIGR04282 family arsenosugar biosynthesis glycosyltransferase [Geotalea uraniireducens]ABQ28188.1 Uncharacterized protein-like protein [Geotalea uraniireducens Rf4]